MFRLINIVILMFVLNLKGYTQDYAKAYFGPLTVISKAQETYNFYGYNFGLAALLGTPGFYMSPGLAYQKFSMTAQFDKNYFHKLPSIHVLKINNDAGIEYEIFGPLRIRFFIGASLNYILSLDDNDHEIDYNSIYDANFSWDYGLGASLSFISIELKIDKGITEVFKDKNKYSNFTMTSINLAFRF